MEDRENKTVAETSFDVLEILPWYRQPKSIFFVGFCYAILCTFDMYCCTHK